MNQLDSKKNKEPESSRSEIQDSSEDENFDIIWSGEPSICSKKLKHYQSFTKCGTTVTVYSFVFILAGDGGHHIGYIEDMYETHKRQKMVKVRWFHQSEEVKDIISNLQPHELIITSQFQNVSADCIDGVATILTPKHYYKCLDLITQDFSDGIYMCSKQIENNKVLSFPFCKLRGYNTQIIFSVLNIIIGPNKNNQEISSKEEEEEEEEKEEEEEEEEEEEKVKEKEEEEDEEKEEKEEEEEEENEEGVESLKGVVVVSDNEVKKRQSFNVGEEIEMLSHDSGMRGCWFRCKILKISKKGLKVLYLDVEDVEGSGNLEEWVVACRIADPDKLGVRWSGRDAIRPCPKKESLNDGFKIGEAVDAWWCDGWWEGVVVGIDFNGKNNFLVYFPGENKMKCIGMMNLRSSKEWVDRRWVEIKPKPEIVSFLKSNLKI